MKFNSIKFEISILYTAILGLILIVFSGVLYFISQAFLEKVDQQLQARAHAVDLAIRSYTSVLGDDPASLELAVSKTIAMKNESFLQYKTWKVSQKWVDRSRALNLDHDYITFVSQDGKIVENSANIDRALHDLFLEDVQLPPPGGVNFWTLNVRKVDIRVVNYRFEDQHHASYLIQVGVPQEPLMQQLRNWLYSIAISVPLILIMTNFVGRLLANRILRPVYEITDMAKKITEHDLSGRIKTRHFDKEMRTLIDSFNEMIARLEKSFKHIEQFSYHVAHELKTPLTIIQGEANLLLRKERSVDEYKQALRIIMEESQRVLKTVDDLLLLTKLGYQPEVFNFADFDFFEFFSEIIEQSRMVTADRGMGIRMSFPNITPPLMINADRLHLRRLFFNLLDRAIRLTPEGGFIDVLIEQEDEKVITFIKDAGPGIPPDQLSKIFEEFDQGRQQHLSQGLGLYIAYTIAQIHHGEIQVESHEGLGTTFKIILPLCGIN